MGMNSERADPYALAQHAQLRRPPDEPCHRLSLLRLRNVVKSCLDKPWLDKPCPDRGRAR